MLNTECPNPNYAEIQTRRFWHFLIAYNTNSSQCAKIQRSEFGRLLYTYVCIVYSACPKTECPKSGKHRKPNFWWFGFQHFFKRSGLIIFGNKPNAFRFRFLGLNVQKHSDFGQFCPKIEQPYYSLAFRRSKT